MMRSNKVKCRSVPTKDMVKRTLAAAQTVLLAKGYSEVRDRVYVENYVQERNSIHFPEFGKYKSFDEIIKHLQDTIEKRFPKIAFPYRHIENEITLCQRNPNDEDYLVDIGTFKVEDQNTDNNESSGTK